MRSGRNSPYLALLFALLLCAAQFCYGAEKSAAHEVWTGTYKCSATAGDSGQSSGYSTPIRLELDGGRARITRDSARIAETLSGDVAAAGTLKLEGTGRWKESGGSSWRYRFDGKFEGDQFKARGEMLSANRGTKLRDCSMALTRVATASAARAAQIRQPAANEGTQKRATAEKSEPTVPPAVAEALLPPKEKTQLKPAGPPEQASDPSARSPGSKPRN